MLDEFLQSHLLPIARKDFLPQQVVAGMQAFSPYRQISDILRISSHGHESP